MQNKKLNKRDIQIIQRLAREKLIEYCKLNDVIGTGVFSILEKDNKVLYYPLEDQQVWGFSEIIKGKSFVCINTSLPYDKQVFAAAHELYHVWFGSSGEIMISKDSQEPDSEEEIELYANRFAAEFLVNEELLRQEMKVFDIDKDSLGTKEIVKLANLFTFSLSMRESRSRSVSPHSGCSLAICASSLSWIIAIALCIRPIRSLDFSVNAFSSSSPAI